MSLFSIHSALGYVEQLHAPGGRIRHRLKAGGKIFNDFDFSNLLARATRALGK